MTWPLGLPSERPKTGGRCARWRWS
jgi:hypothetical protein